MRHKTYKLCFALFLVESTGQCLPGWLKNGSSCYQFNAVKVDWFKAVVSDSLSTRNYTFFLKILKSYGAFHTIRKVSKYYHTSVSQLIPSYTLPSRFPNLNSIRAHMRRACVRACVCVCVCVCVRYYRGRR